MVGTPLYRHTYGNKDTDTGCVVAAEVDLISNRLLGTEPEKESVLPVLLKGKRNIRCRRCCTDACVRISAMTRSISGRRSI
jgi:hypothetical protein